MSEELIPVERVPEVGAATFVVSDELQKAIDAAQINIKNRSFFERNPQLGRMVNCQVCRTRHRLNERKCVQVFTYRVGDYELLKENDKGELVPAYRTCVEEGVRPTMKQVMGAATFKKKRFHPHPSKMKLLFIERTREIFGQLGFSLDEPKSETFQKNLQRARVLAAREIRREREISDREYRRRADQARRINRGLKVTVRA